MTEHRFSWNKCFIIYRMKATDSDAACRNTSETVKLKVYVLQHPCVLLSWYDVTSYTTRNSCRTTKMLTHLAF